MYTIAIIIAIVADKRYYPVFGTLILAIKAQERCNGDSGAFAIMQVCNVSMEISRRQAVGLGGTHSAQFLNHYMLFIKIFPKT